MSKKTKGKTTVWDLILVIMAGCVIVMVLLIGSLLPEPDYEIHPVTREFVQLRVTETCRRFSVACNPKINYAMTHIKPTTICHRAYPTDDRAFWDCLELEGFGQ